jgi:four helix bundle protein
MATIRRFEDINGWKKTREFVREIYKASLQVSLAKDFGLQDQLRRAAVSSMSNIAEGFARRSDKDFAHFLDMAKGSVVEPRSLLYVALDVNYLDERDFQRLYQLANEVASLIGGLTSFL